MTCPNDRLSPAGGGEPPNSKALHSLPVSEHDLLHLLRSGDVELQGLVPWSSNFTFLVNVRQGDRQVLAIYKPSRGEQPLWDFDLGSLCRREVAAYLLSQALGWPSVPPVVLRDGPEGVGTVQLLIDCDWDEHYFTIRRDPAHKEALSQIALFDYITNNADRKGGHVLKGKDGRLWAIDHGLTFHADYKLRTVIWDYAGQPIDPGSLAQLQALERQLVDEEAAVTRALQALLEPFELVTLRRRVGELVRRARFPRPRRDWRNTPYPLV